MGYLYVLSPAQETELFTAWLTGRTKGTDDLFRKWLRAIFTDYDGAIPPVIDIVRAVCVEGVNTFHTVAIVSRDLPFPRRTVWERILTND